MPALSISRNGANTPIPTGNYHITLVTELRDGRGTGINRKEIITEVTTSHTLGSLAAGLTTLLKVPGTVIDLVIAPK